MWMDYVGDFTWISDGAKSKNLIGFGGREQTANPPGSLFKGGIEQPAPRWGFNRQSKNAVIAMAL
jgi:hypothetical protein